MSFPRSTTHYISNNDHFKQKKKGRREPSIFVLKNRILFQFLNEKKKVGDDDSLLPLAAANFSLSLTLWNPL